MTCALSVLGCSPGQETPRRTTSSSASARLVAAGRGSRSPSGPLTGAAAPPVPRRAPRRPPRRAGPGSCSSSPGPRSCAGPGPAGAAPRRVRGPSPAWSAAPRTGSPEPAPARSGRGRRGRPRLPRPARPHQRPRSRARPPPRRRRRNGPPARPCQRHRPGTERLRERLTRRTCPEHPCATRSTDVTCCTLGLGADEPAAATSQSIVDHPFAFADPRCTTSPATATSTRSRAHRSRPMRLIAAASPSSP